MKKVIILVMSCKQERFINEEQVIRETYAKDIINNKYDNIKIIFYRGGYEEDKYDEESNMLYLKSDDTLNGTYCKSVDAFNFISKNFEFDYVIRTNTSTYININAILQFLNFDLNDEVMYGPFLNINDYAKWIPYLGGHFLIIPKKHIDILCNKQKFENGIDDACFGHHIANYYMHKYCDHILEVDSIISLENKYIDKLKTAYCVRIKDEKNYENNIIRMIGLHALYKNIETKINPPHPFKYIYTCYGKIPI
jgi:hypothetical protein